jgi:hypothetical protein
MSEPLISQSKSIETIGEGIELHPVYERDIRWSEEKMCDIKALLKIHIDASYRYTATRMVYKV